MVMPMNHNLRCSMILIYSLDFCNFIIYDFMYNVYLFILLLYYCLYYILCMLLFESMRELILKNTNFEVS